MDGLEGQLLTLGVGFVLVLARVGGVVATAPLLSDTSIPVRVKALLAVALSALVAPMALAAATLPEQGTLVELGVSVAREAVVGVALGMGVAVVLSGVQLAGQIVGQMSGMALAEGVDPAFGSSASVFGQMYYLTTTAVFVAAGGHGQVVGGLLDTFDHAPIGEGFATAPLAELFLGLLAAGFELGLRAAAPMLVALLLATVVLGLVSRTLPQINTMVVGFGLNAMLTLGVMTASVGAAAWTFQAPLAATIESVVEAVGATPPAAP